jgi:hypothetical protein
MNKFNKLAESILNENSNKQEVNAELGAKAIVAMDTGNEHVVGKIQQEGYNKNPKTSKAFEKNWIRFSHDYGGSWSNIENQVKEYKKKILNGDKYLIKMAKKLLPFLKL